ncbi:MAG: hypothetical protein ACFB2W_07355 [Leptolyngbyaceae cyanobacterium]
MENLWKTPTELWKTCGFCGESFYQSKNLVLLILEIVAAVSNHSMAAATDRSIPLNQRSQKPLLSGPLGPGFVLEDELG